MPDFLPSRPGRCFRLLTGLALGALGLLGACQSRQAPADAPATPPVGHYQGGLTPAGQPELRAALDIRHPRPGHYEAELTVPGAPTLSFVADTILLAGQQLRLLRPARPGQTLTLTLDGDFWRGTLAVDSTQVPLILLKRGVPDPSAYRVQALPQVGGPAWLFVPTDTDTPGAALALLPDAATAPTAALWADALARAGIIVLLLPPPADSASASSETPLLQLALQRLRATAGADTASVGVWATGARATALLPALAAAGGPRVAFFVAQNAALDARARAAVRGRKLPMLGLYGGTEAASAAASLRTALAGRRGSAVHSYRGTGPDLLVPTALGPKFGPGLPGEVVGWLRNR